MNLILVVNTGIVSQASGLHKQVPRPMFSPRLSQLGSATSAEGGPACR